jgi:hypothetical protein
MSLSAGNLFISSYNNQDFDTSTNFQIILSVPVNKAKRLRLLGATIANLMNPFSTNDSQWTFTIKTIGNVSTTYTTSFPIDRRWADMTAFLAYVNGTMFPGASPSAIPATLAYDADRNQLYLTATVLTSTITMPGWNWNNTLGTATAYNANYRLGWSSIAPAVSTSGVLYADGFPNVFLRTNNIYVITNICADSNNDANIGNILGRIPVNAGFGGIVTYENVHSDFASPVFCENIKEVRIRLLDEDYQPITNPGNAYFNIVIGIEY